MKRRTNDSHHVIDQVQEPSASRTNVRIGAILGIEQTRSRQVAWTQAQIFVDRSLLIRRHRSANAKSTASGPRVESIVPHARNFVDGLIQAREICHLAHRRQINVVAARLNNGRSR
jgi:hypothetical protein